MKTNITYKEINKLPVLVIDNFFDKEDQKLILQELKFLTPKLYDPSKTGTAKDENGVIMKKNKAIFLDTTYSDRNVSDILNLTKNIFSRSNMELYKEYHPFFNYVSMANADGTIVSYYEHSDNYAAHCDSAIITALFWFYEEPKCFKGGDLILNNELVVECKSNRLLLFPSAMLHEVSPVSMKTQDLNQCKGRYTITKLMSIYFQSPK